MRKMLWPLDTTNCGSLQPWIVLYFVVFCWGGRTVCVCVFVLYICCRIATTWPLLITPALFQGCQPGHFYDQIKVTKRLFAALGQHSSLWPKTTTFLRSQFAAFHHHSLLCAKATTAGLRKSGLPKIHLVTCCWCCCGGGCGGGNCGGGGGGSGGGGGGTKSNMLSQNINMLSQNISLQYNKIW